MAKTFVAVGYGTWGRGKSIREAIKVARTQGGRNKLFVVWSTQDEKAQVDGMGYLLTDSSLPTPENVGTFNWRGTAQEAK